MSDRPKYLKEAFASIFLVKCFVFDRCNDIVQHQTGCGDQLALGVGRVVDQVWGLERDELMFRQRKL